jgi:hypothetical protein
MLKHSLEKFKIKGIKTCGLIESKEKRWHATSIDGLFAAKIEPNFFHGN